MNSQREAFEKLMCRALPHTHRNDGRFCVDGRGDYQLIGIWTAFQCYKQMLSEQAATEQGVNPVRGDSVSIDVSTSETTAGNRVFGTLTGERNGDPERTWLAELDHFNYSTEQGVGEAFAYYNPADIYWIRNGGGVTFCGQKTETFSEPVYRHPPKPTGGGVPDKIAINGLIEASRCLGIAQYKIDFDAVKHWEQQVDSYRALLATQQPPEPSTEVKRSRLYEIAEYLRGIGNTADASHVENCAVAMQSLRDEYREFTRQPIDSEGGHHD